MKVATLKFNIIPKDRGKNTYNSHFLDKDIKYEVLSEQSKVMGFPYILMHPTFKNIYLVDTECMNIYEK